MSRKRLVASVLLASLLTTGCWDRREINDVGFALATAIDLVDAKEGTMRSVVQVAIPTALSPVSKQGQGGRETVMQLSAEGKTLDVMRSDVQRQLSRNLNTSHRRVIVIGEELARYGLQDIMDSFSRNPVNRLRTFILIAKGMKGADLIDVRYPIEPYPSEGMRELEKMGFGSEVTLREFFVAATMPGSQPYMSSYMLVKNERKAFAVNGIAVFRGLKLAGYLDAKASQGFLLLLGKLRIGSFTVQTPSGDGKSITIRLKDLHTQADVQVQGGKPKARYRIEMTGEVSENTTRLDLMNPKYIRELNEAVRKEVVSQAESAVRKLKSYKSDALGIGTQIYRKQPELWEKIRRDWPERFAQQDVEITAVVNVQHVGMLGPQLELREEEVRK